MAKHQLPWSSMTTLEVDEMVTRLMRNPSRAGRRLLARCIVEQRRRHGTAPMTTREVFQRLQLANAQ